MQVIKARKLWENGQYMGDIATVYNFPCDRITNSTPRDGWIIPTEGCCGNPTFYRLSLTDPQKTAALRGVWIEFDGQGVLIDAESVDDVVAKCNGCCGDAAAVDGRYDGVYPNASNVAQLATYQITRSDAGTLRDTQKMRLDYLGEYVEGSFSVISQSGTVSVYQMKAYKDPRPKGTDAITSETNRVFTSNVPAALAGGMTYELTLVADGVEQPKITGVDLAALVTAAQGNATLNALGAWAVAAGAVTLTGTKVTKGLINIEQIAAA